MGAGIIEDQQSLIKRNIRLEIFDDFSFNKNKLLYDNLNYIDKKVISSPLFSLKYSASLNGNLWYLRFTQYDFIEAGLDYSKIWYIATGGTGISILFFLLYLLLINTNIRAHKLAEELTRDLSESETKYKTIFNNGIYAVCIFDFGTLKFLDVNEAHCLMYGFSKEEFLSGMTVSNILTEHQTDSSYIIERTIKHGSLFTPLRYHKKKDGIVFPVEIVNGIYMWQGKKVMFSLTHDITERIFAEGQLKKWAHIFDNIKLGIAVGNSDMGRLDLINPAFAEMHGFTLKELTGKPVADVFAPESRNEVIHNIEKVHQLGHYAWEAMHIRKDGTIFPVLIDVAAVKDDNGTALYRVANVQDITERKLADDILRKSISRFELAMYAANMAWWEMELPSGTVTFGKRKAEMLGFPPEKFKHYKDFTDLVHPDDYEQIMHAMREHLNGKSDKYETEYRILTKDNGYRWFYDTGSVVEGDPDRKQIKLTGLVLDITERKTAQLELWKLYDDLHTSKALIEEALSQEHLLMKEVTQTKEKLEKINAEKDKLFSIIAHDLKSPFQGFIGLTGVMAGDISAFAKDELSQIGREMHITSKNLFTLLNNLLEWARMQQGAISFEPVEIVLSDIVSQNIDLIIKRGEQKGIEIINEINPVQIVFADEPMLNSILRNLLTNAVKFTMQGGKVNVSSKEIGHELVEISVTDSGIGMSEDLSEKLFKPDEKVGRKGTDGEPSTGLGLLLCKEFVEKHGGKIWVTSEKGKETIFSFTIPATNRNLPPPM
ncbi:MAG: PAS domain S-box protein [Ignavibacteria bacterium]